MMSTSSIPPVALPIITQRLIIREYVETDVHHVQRNVGDPAYWNHHATEPPTPERLEALIVWAIQEQKLAPRLNYYLAVTTKDSATLIGEAVLRIADPQNRQGEIGFGVARSHWRLGYATEMAQALLRIGFGPLGLHRLFAQCAPENAPSIRVMQKLGMAREGILRDIGHARGRWWSSAIYAIIDREYAKISKLK
jgi:[ribosomal protein S5]-alanine N-acetyltransferase